MVELDNAAAAWNLEKYLCTDPSILTKVMLFFGVQHLKSARGEILRKALMRAHMRLDKHHWVCYEGWHRQSKTRCRCMHTSDLVWMWQHLHLCFQMVGHVTLGNVTYPFVHRMYPWKHLSRIFFSLRFVKKIKSQPTKWQGFEPALWSWCIHCLPSAFLQTVSMEIIRCVFPWLQQMKAYRLHFHSFLN